MRRFWRRAIVARFEDPAWRSTAWLVVATLGLMIFMVRVLGASWPKQFAIFYPDSFSFKNAARHTPFSPAFYVAERPIAYPALLFLLGRSTVVTVVVQTLLYGVAYIFAMRTLWHLLGTNVARVVGVFLLVTIAIEPRFALWNTHILSESFGQTLGVVSVVAWWRFACAPSTRRLHLAGLATLGWCLARDSNVPPWVIVGVPALLASSVWWQSAGPDLRRALRVWGIVTFVVCIGAGISQGVNGRNRYPTMNNVGLRVLPDAELTEWFDDMGMPLDDALRARSGKSAFDDGWYTLTSPELERFRDWADGSGQSVMVLSYIRFLPHWVDKLYDDLPILLATDQRSYDVFGVAERLPDPPPLQLGGPVTRGGLVAWTSLAAAGLALAALRRRGREAIVLGLLLASTFVDLYFAYVGDSVEVQRHMVGPLARMALLLTLCVMIGGDVAAGWLRTLLHPGLEPAEPRDASAELEEAPV